MLSLLAALAPLLTRVIGRWFAVPIVVFELVLGILVGPSVLAWVEPVDFFAALAQFGLAMLFFVAGSELDFTAFRGRTGRNAAVGWLLSLGIGILIGLLVGPLGAAIIIGIALSTAILPTLSRFVGSKNTEGAARILCQAVEQRIERSRAAVDITDRVPPHRPTRLRPGSPSRRARGRTSSAGRSGEALAEPRPARR